MSDKKVAFEREYADALNILYTNLQHVLGTNFTFERYIEWVGLWNRPTRVFHGLKHMLGMSELNKDLPESAGIYAMVAGFWHDVEYPSIGEAVTEVSKRFIDKYIDHSNGKSVLKPLADGDTVGSMLYTIFGMQAGAELNAFNGINEFYSAAAAVGELQELRKDNKFIAAIITAIEATIPFRKPERMNELRSRLETANNSLTLGLKPADIDEMMIAAVHTANHDVMGFLGGLDPNTNSPPTTLSVINTILGGDRLSPEEIQVMSPRTKPLGSKPGEYPFGDFLKARLKRAGLYQLVINGNPEKQSIDNLFYECTLSDGGIYPKDGWVEKANKLAYANNLPVRTAEYARLISQAIVYSIAKSAEIPEDTQQIVLVNEIKQRMAKNLPKDADKIRQLAFECVNGRKTAESGDTTRSALAELVISQLTVKQIETLALKARELLNITPENPIPATDEFIAVAQSYLGDSVNLIRDEMVISAITMGKPDIAEALQQVAIKNSPPATIASNIERDPRIVRPDQGIV